ncbi:hypothetical protein N9B72_00975 [Bacteriovoracaceae bacterium]|nr:hypothetical protein [Bacteriovoracaceae bacterium]
MHKLHSILLILFWLSSFTVAQYTYAQTNPATMLDSVEEDLNVGGDIFNNFNEDLEASQVVEDERFYRYGRFYSLNVGIGMTRFQGNRGRAYTQNFDPSFNISLNYFFDFLSSFSLGFQYSRHAMFVDTTTLGYPDPPGTIEVTMLRPFFAFRYYMDTSNYGNAITYSNPYALLRLEYWRQTNKFPESKELDDQSGGGIGVGLGLGLEFPIEIKKTYVGVEFLWHNVAFFDKFTKDYAFKEGVSDAGVPTYEDLTGNGYSVFITYNVSW